MRVDVTSLEERIATIAVQGRVDASTYQDLQDVMNALDDKVEAVVFDFRDVEYISSAGLRVVMTAGKRYGAANVSITNVVSEVFEVFHMAGFDDIFDIQTAGEDVASYIRHSFKDILAKKVQNCPEIPAVKHLGVTYTWADLEACAQICAHDLFQLGVRKGSHVGICAANSANWIICFYAVQKLGAIACLMNYNYSQNEIVDVSDVGDITFLCIGESTACGEDRAAFAAAVMRAEGSKIEQVYDIASTLNYKDRLHEYESVQGLYGVTVESDDVCVMIYTSGSTGVPKGVLLSAYNILNASQTMAEEIEISDADKLCLIIPLFHIFGMTAGLFCNVLRNCLVIIPDTIRTDTILSTIADERCTLFHSVPTMVLALMNNKRFDENMVLSLRCTLLAGAPATEAQIIQMSKVFPHNHFVGAYGLSEMAPVSMTTYDDTVEHVATTVGRPLSNIRIKIVDPESDEDLPAGEAGEIVVEGFNLMTCYYKASLDLQAVDESGWLHTGDLGFFDDEGYLHLTGRAKELIIRGGENIMPLEIAEAISEFPGVADVKVQGVPDDFFGEVVGASVVMKDGEALDVDALLEFLKTHLAKYKLPAYVFQYDAFPMLANGKVDAVGLKKDMNARAAALKA